MPLTNAGRDVIAAMLLGEATTDFNNANARLGVGTSSTAFSAAQTDLQAGGVRKAMNATYPQRAANVLTFQATFLEADANQVWAEWGVFNSSSGPTMLSRKVEALGTKPSTEQWRLGVTLTITAA